MKRKDLVKRIAKEAKRQGVSWTVRTEGSKHSLYVLGSTTIPIPRHNELKELTCEDIFKECEPELGTRWWKR